MLGPTTTAVNTHTHIILRTFIILVTTLSVTFSTSGVKLLVCDFEPLFSDINGPNIFALQPYLSCDGGFSSFRQAAC